MIKLYTVNIIFGAEVSIELTPLWVFWAAYNSWLKKTHKLVRQPVVNIKNLDCKELSRKGKLERIARVDGGQLGS